MGFIDKKIIAADYTGKDVAGLPDKPSESGISAATLKARFDALTKDLSAVNFNALIDELVALTAASQLGVETVTGIVGNDIQTVLNNLKLYTDSELGSRDTLISNLDSAVVSLSGTKADKTDVYTKSELDLSINYLSGLITLLETNKANKADVYTKTEADTLLSDKANQVTTYNKLEVDALIDGSGGGGASTFVGLTDTPLLYLGQSGKVPAVKATEDGLEFVEQGGGTGGSVESVNGKTGVVVLTASDVAAYNKTEIDNKVKTDVPLGALFTDTIVDISGKADKTQVLTDVPAGAVFTDTVFSGNADDVSITDVGLYYDSTNVEGALQEVGANKVNKPSQLFETTTVTDTDIFLVEDNANTKKMTWANLKTAIINSISNGLFQYHNAGSHNSIYRGKYLGSSYTAEQKAMIDAGTFDDLYVGDYWTIGGVNWRIAGFDYYYNLGNIALTQHHAVIVPDTSLYNAQMNTSNITTGAYQGSAMRTANLATAITTINNAFGSANVLTHRQLLTSVVTSGASSSWGWIDASVEIMSEVMVYGTNAWGANPNREVGSSNGRLPLFTLRQDSIYNRQNFWLRDVVSSTKFANVSENGNSSDRDASDSIGVRPCFLIS